MSEFEPETVAKVKNDIPCKRHNMLMRDHSMGLISACLYGEPDEWGNNIQRRTYLRFHGYTHDELEAMSIGEIKAAFEEERAKAAPQPPETKEDD